MILTILPQKDPTSVYVDEKTIFNRYFRCMKYINWINNLKKVDIKKIQKKEYYAKNFSSFVPLIALIQLLLMNYPETPYVCCSLDI